jgi:hypothetical protein
MSLLLNVSIRGLVHARIARPPARVHSVGWRRAASPARPMPHRPCFSTSLIAGTYDRRIKNHNTITAAERDSSSTRYCGKTSIHIIAIGKGPP